MIARTWRGWTTAADADEYQGHYEAAVGGQLRPLPGFQGARLLRAEDGDEVLFTSIIYFSDLEDVRAFAGEDFERAVVEEAARRVLTRWDERVAHHRLAVEIPEP